MEVEIGRKLIEDAINPVAPQVWADLGAGKGFFTKILGSLLAKESVIYAVDRDRKVNTITVDRVSILPIVADFSSPPAALLPLDGIILGNALHYVKDKIAFFKVWKQYLKEDSIIIVIEYDTDRANQWVPYPCSFETLHALGKQIRAEVSLLSTAPSIYQQSGIYSSVIRLKN